MAKFKGTRNSDIIVGSNTPDRIRGKDGDDVIFGYGDGSGVGGTPPGVDPSGGGPSDADDIEGGKGDDTIYAGGGEDEVEGGKGDDVIDGGAGNDSLHGDGQGGRGDDIITGGMGDDFMRGGRGADTYVLKPGDGDDQIGDFVIGEDALSLQDGLAIASARIEDANGDGKDDTVVVFDSGGSVTLLDTVLPTVDPFPAVIELSELLPANGGDGDGGFVINGIEAGDQSGRSVSAAGDVNGDGIDDLIIGAPYADPNGSISGQSYVIFGSDEGFDAAFELSSLATGGGSEGFVINGIDATDGSGWSVSAAGDVNDDGIDDVIIGALIASPNGIIASGQSYVIFGSDDGFDAVFELSSLASGGGSEGFVINGIDDSDRSGSSVSAAGDLNDDGIDDLIIGASFADPNGSLSGESYVVFGSDEGFDAVFELSSLATGGGSEGFVINGIDEENFSGDSVSAAGDVNGDGIDDLIIGAYGADPNGSRSGQSYVVFGSDDGFDAVLELSSLAGGDGSEGFVINGIDTSDQSGISVSAAGDLNGDGIDDLIIGAFGADPNGSGSGESYVVFGSDQGLPAVIELSSLASGDGSTGFVMNGINSGDGSGISVSAAGDVDGDGIDDLIIGASFADPNGSVSGQSYVIYGSDEGFPAAIELSSLLPTNGGDGGEGFVINGIDGSDRSGDSVSAAGDLNGDGIDDLIIGAFGADPNGSGSGESYVVFGIDTTALDTDLLLDTGAADALV
jgi:hypothetical protein